MLQVAKNLADKQFKVLLMDGHLYQPGLAHLITDNLGDVLEYEHGQSLYELLIDHEILRSAGINSGEKEEKKLFEQLNLKGVEVYNGFAMPDVVGRIIHLPNQERIDVILGCDPQNINIKTEVDLARMFKKNYGYEFANYLKEKLRKLYDFILIDVQVGFSPMSGLLCGQISDTIMAIDVDNPIYKHLPSYQVGQKLAEKINQCKHSNISVKSVQGSNIEQIVKLIIDENEVPDSR